MGPNETIKFASKTGQVPVALNTTCVATIKEKIMLLGLFEARKAVLHGEGIEVLPHVVNPTQIVP